VKNHDDAEPYDPPVPVLPGEAISGAIQLTGPLGARPRIEPPHGDLQSPQEKQAVKISEGVEQAQLVSRIEPRYPILAIQTKTQGPVRLRAIISRDGRITSLEVISGHPLLVQAALDAVGQWRYRPTLLTGEPVEVETFITVFFVWVNKIAVPRTEVGRSIRCFGPCFSLRGPSSSRAGRDRVAESI
jgi:TonB family protein